MMSVFRKLTVNLST